MDGSRPTATQRWAAALADWAVPEDILASAGRSPWGHPVARFAARAEHDVARPAGASFEAARAALGAGGTVLDVGAGAGAAGLPLAAWATGLTAVDTRPEMLAALADRAAALGLPVRTVVGRWPDVAPEAGDHDVVVCHHVLYDVPALGSFLAALTERARRRVVVEVTPAHPLSWTAPLWQRFHGLERPTRPLAEDVVAVLEELGVRGLATRRWEREDVDPTSPEERVALVTRRLCLPEAREPEVAAALADLPRAELRPVVTLAWDGTAPTTGPADRA